LAQFQATKFTQPDTLKMLMDMNSHLESPLEKDVLETSFHRGLPDLETDLKLVPEPSGDTSKPASRGHLKTGQLKARPGQFVLPHQERLWQHFDLTFSVAHAELA